MGRVLRYLAAVVLFAAVAATTWGSVAASSTWYVYDEPGRAGAALGIGFSVDPLTGYN